MEYFKLGENATIFYDPTTQFKIVADEVIEVKTMPRSKKIGIARRSGHIVTSSKAEFDAYIKSLDGTADEVPVTVVAKPVKKGKGKKEEEDDYEYNPDLLQLTPAEFRAKIADEGFLEEDVEKFDDLKDIKVMIKLFDEINKQYT